MSYKISRVRKAMAGAGLDALLVSSAVEDTNGTHSQNRQYISGFRGSTGLALLTAEDALLAVDFRYAEQAEKEAEGFTVWPTPPERRKDWLPSLFLQAQLAGKKLGLSRDDFSLAEYLSVTETVDTMDTGSGPEVTAAPRLIEKLRQIKAPEEVALLEKSVHVADRAYESVLDAVAPGQLETEVSQAVEAAVRREGGERVSFETIVGSGPRAAMPHHTPEHLPLGTGEMLVIDMGAQAGGYCSDLTRTTPMGEPDDRFREIYDIVFAAQNAAITKVESGMPASVVDQLARGVIESAGYGEQFGHGLGHGVGLQIHEDPYLGHTSEDVLEEGMVFTIEPGIYIPGWGGVRIEDVVALENGRGRVLSEARKLPPFGVIR